MNPSDRLKALADKHAELVIASPPPGENFAVDYLGPLANLAGDFARLVPEVEAVANVEHLEIPEGAVIIIRDPDRELDDEATFQSFASMLHELHPLSLVVFLSGDTTLETMDADNLRQMLEHLIEHQEATGG